ncbi:SRPBCC family protein [Pseudoalteromonas sp. OOF1S-7]|uniref:type II toxin-antitoxin system RatA family toxin n=1 Tax=Pseudoalteromonas sp. OOF1S-7 TaxID=2917757 RepID=UPI001EF660FA|nr:SRPBCC family protein [Pseudoalteromonas sp. OOF1S-7]MCG7537520.1 SRPBCC family protein [Pseudoalteromonas sp. OOF1S-7]
MRRVEIHAVIPNTQADHVFDTLSDFRHYAELVDTVVSVEMDRESAQEAQSSWVVKFRNGLLKWTERDWFKREELRLEFEQIDGDFEEFLGAWHIEQLDGDVRVALIVDFDFGVPSLESIVNPVAARVLTDVTQQILKGLFSEDVRFNDAPQESEVELSA